MSGKYKQKFPNYKKMSIEPVHRVSQEDNFDFQYNTFDMRGNGYFNLFLKRRTCL